MFDLAQEVSGLKNFGIIAAAGDGPRPGVDGDAMRGRFLLDWFSQE